MQLLLNLFAQAWPFLSRFFYCSRSRPLSKKQKSSNIIHYRDPVREEQVKLKWADQFWSRSYKPSQLNMFVNKYEQLENFIFKGHDLPEQKKNLHEILIDSVARINRVKKKLGNGFDKRLTFNMFQQESRIYN